MSTVADSWDDEALLAALQQALRARRAVPPEFVEAARAPSRGTTSTPSWPSSPTTRSATPSRWRPTRAEAASIRALTFTSAHLTIELEVTPDSLVGQIVPVQAATIEVQARAGDPVPVAADEIGCFLDPPHPGRPVPAALPFRGRRRRAHRLDHL